MVNPAFRRIGIDFPACVGIVIGGPVPFAGTDADVPRSFDPCRPAPDLDRHDHHGPAEEGIAEALDARAACRSPRPTASAWRAAPSPCASCRRARTSPRRNRGRRRARPARPSRTMPEGCIAVVDAMGVIDAGIFGDILTSRMAKRGVSALVTDGVVRDLAGVLRTGLPTWCQGTAAPASVAGLTFVGWQEPVACGGVAVFPDDVIVADVDGAVLHPRRVSRYRAEGRSGAGAAGGLDHGLRSTAACRCRACTRQTPRPRPATRRGRRRADLARQSALGPADAARDATHRGKRRGACTSSCRRSCGS